MATDKAVLTNIDNSDPANYPNARIKDNSGSGDGTPVNRLVYSDLHEFFAKLMRLADRVYNGLPDNESNGYQLVDAAADLAGKNDIIVPVNTTNIIISGVATDVITVTTKLNILKLNEVMICKAAVNHDGEVKIKGSTSTIYTADVPSPYKAGDYLSLIKTNTGFSLIRLADALNLDTLAAELLYLKGATTTEEYAGLATTKASTPYTSQLAFARRVIGLDSGTFLATTSRNGLLSKEDKAVIDASVSKVKNTGWFSGIDPGSGSVGSLAPRSGDVVSAVIQSKQVTTGYSDVVYLVTIANAMPGAYFVRTMLESEGTIGLDNDVASPVFKRVSSTTFLWTLQDLTPGAQNIKAHIEVVDIS